MNPMLDEKTRDSEIARALNLALHAFICILAPRSRWKANPSFAILLER